MYSWVHWHCLWKAHNILDCGMACASLPFADQISRKAARCGECCIWTSSPLTMRHACDGFKCRGVKAPASVDIGSQAPAPTAPHLWNLTPGRRFGAAVGAETRHGGSQPSVEGWTCRRFTMRRTGPVNCCHPCTGTTPVPSLRRWVFDKHMKAVFQIESASSMLFPFPRDGTGALLTHTVHTMFPVTAVTYLRLLSCVHGTTLVPSSAWCLLLHTMSAVPHISWTAAAHAVPAQTSNSNHSGYSDLLCASEISESTSSCIVSVFDQFHVKKEGLLLLRSSRRLTKFPPESALPSSMGKP